MKRREFMTASAGAAAGTACSQQQAPGTSSLLSTWRLAEAKPDPALTRAAMTYRDMGYEYMLMPDHVPRHPDDQGGYQASAFDYGHIKAVLQALEHIA